MVDLSTKYMGLSLKSPIIVGSSGLTNNVEANYDESSVRGRSEPHPFYMDTGADTYSFDIKLVSSVDGSSHPIRQTNSTPHHNPSAVTTWFW